MDILSVSLLLWSLPPILSQASFTNSDAPNMANDTMDASLWAGIQMPKKSHFAGMGFLPPTDTAKWATALENAKSGKLILLQTGVEHLIPVYPVSIGSPRSLIS